MRLPKELHERLASEFRFAATSMSETDNPHEKLYFFSVFFGEVVRVLNWHWDKELALIWLVTQQTQQQAASRLQSITRQGEPVVRLSDEYFNTLTVAAAELADYVEKDGTEHELCELMEKFSELTYVTTGNGYYLFRKGAISL